jgi:hypothetical protein
MGTSFPERGDAMMSSSAKTTWLAGVALGAVFAVGAGAQSTANPGTMPPPSGVPIDPAAPTMATRPPAGTMSSGELKEQRKQQKRVEAAAKANVKAADASAKSKVANDKALQAQEKSGQVVPAPAATTPPPAAVAPATSGPPQ